MATQNVLKLFFMTKTSAKQLLDGHLEFCRPFCNFFQNPRWPPHSKMAAQKCPNVNKFKILVWGTVPEHLVSKHETVFLKSRWQDLYRKTGAVYHCRLWLGQNGKWAKYNVIQFGPKKISIVCGPCVTPCSSSVAIRQHFRKMKHPRLHAYIFYQLQFFISWSCICVYSTK